MFVLLLDLKPKNGDRRWVSLVIEEMLGAVALGLNRCVHRSEVYLEATKLRQSMCTAGP